MRGLFTDLRHAARGLSASPGYTLPAVLTLALGIGASVAIFTVVDAVLLQPLPFPESDRLVALCERTPSTAEFCIVSPPSAEAWADVAGLESFGIGRTQAYQLRGPDGRVTVRGAMATAGLFETLVVQPELGRVFRDDETTARVALLSGGLATRWFGSPDAALNESLSLDDIDHRVVGVLPTDLDIPLHEGVEVWVPLPFEASDPGWRSWGWFGGLGRLAPGVSPEAAVAELAAIQAGQVAGREEMDGTWTVDLPPLQELIVGDVRPLLFSFLGAVGLLLAIAVANVASLMLARSTRRHGESVVRVALGAPLYRLIRLHVAEGALLALAGAAAGALVASFGLDALLAAAPTSLPRADQIGPSGTVLLFTVVLTAATALVTATLPALRAIHVRSAPVAESRIGGSGARARAALVVGQVALASALVIGAGLLTRTLVAYLEWDPGLDPDGLAVSWMLSTPGRFETEGEIVANFERIVERVAAMPGVESASMASAGVVFGGRETGRFLIEGLAVPEPGQEPVLRWHDIGPGYFETLRTRVLRGREIGPEDGAGAPRVALVNEAAVRRYFAGGDPLGAVVSTDGGRSFEIVGVVQDQPPMQPGAPPEPSIYWAFAQNVRLASYLVVRAESGAAGLATLDLERAVLAIDPDMQVTTQRTFAELAGRGLAQPRFNALLVGAFGTSALVLAAVGLYGLLAGFVAAHRHEIGVRMALGAAPGQIRARVLRRGLVLTAVGLAIGVVAAAFGTRAIASLVHGVSTQDPLTYALCGLIFLLVASVACLRPAVAASRLNPVRALRSD